MSFKPLIRGKGGKLKAIACCFVACGLLQVHAQSGSTISIMPLGDSLTWGYDGGPDTTAHLNAENTGGYRTSLYQVLGAQGVGVNYVGAANGNASPVLTLAGQTAQNGYNGYRIDDIANNLAASVPGSDGVDNSSGFWLTGGGTSGRAPATPNIILLQIGANDIEQDFDPLFKGTPGTETSQQLGYDTSLRLEALISEIMYYDPTAYILTDATSPLLNSDFVAQAGGYYEGYTQQMIAANFSGKNVFYVDMQHAIQYNGFYGDYVGDGIHLDAAGYTVMGDTWANAILTDFDFADAESAPEPSTWALLLGGAFALLGYRRLRRTK